MAIRRGGHRLELAQRPTARGGAKEYAAEGGTALLLVKVNGRVSQWLAEHIARTDKAFGEHLRVNKAG